MAKRSQLSSLIGDETCVSSIAVLLLEFQDLVQKAGENLEYSVAPISSPDSLLKPASSGIFAFLPALLSLRARIPRPPLFKRRRETVPPQSLAVFRQSKESDLLRSSDHAFSCGLHIYWPRGLWMDCAIPRHFATNLHCAWEA